MSNQYIHITEYGDLEICTSAELCKNNLNGKLVYPSLLAESFSAIERIILRLIHLYNIKYLVISADPFCLPESHATLFSLLPIPRGLILCDTHHGHRPVSRSLRFCINAKVQSVLLRFNQRHANIFRSNGIWADSTVLSPDLHQLALRKLRTFDRKDRDAREKLVHHRRNLLSHREIISQLGLFVGNTTRIHPFRSYQMKLLREKNIQFDIKSTPNAQCMIELLSTYEWGLNLPLNGDYNRRFIEILLADIPVFAEQLPRSQCIFPFTLLQRHVISFYYLPGLQEIKIDASFYRSIDKPLFLSPLNEILRLVSCGYDAAILASFDSSLRRDFSDRISNEKNSIFADIELYDECLLFNTNPLVVSQQEARQLMSRAARIGPSLKLLPDEEFLRLNAYASL